MTNPPILPVPSGLPDEEARFRDAINRIMGQMISTMDAAIGLRTAPQEAQRQRHMARGKLLEAALLMANAHAISRASTPAKDR